MNINILKKKMDLKNYVFYGLMALELLMSFTFLGYIHIEPISITFAYIPVVIAGCFLGTAQSTIIGFVCGLASMYKATAYYVMPYDKLFSPFMSGYPIRSFVLSVATRTLFGLIVGLLFWIVRKNQHRRRWSVVIAFFAPKLHSVVVYFAMKSLFSSAIDNFGSTFQLDVSSFMTALLCAVLVVIIWWFIDNDKIRVFRQYVEQENGIFYREEHISWQLTAFMLGILAAATVAAFYFSQRMTYMLSAYGMNVSEDMGHDLLHLQIQFMIAMIALLFIMVLVLMIIFRAIAYREYLGQMDSLTGVMNRKMFLKYCDQIQNVNREATEKNGCYMFIDVDHFKSINDTFGHPEGDKVLRQIAQSLQEHFGFRGGIGRMGGDEFAVIFDSAVNEAEIKRRLEQFQTDIADILGVSMKVTCSVGVCRFIYPQDMQNIYKKADEMLYQAKAKGRDCYVIGMYDCK